MESLTLNELADAPRFSCASDHLDAQAETPLAASPGGGRALSVKTTLRLAFASLLVGTVVIGGFALVQIHRIGASTQLIYDQGYIASTAAEEARGYVLRASRAQKSLLTASTAKERDELGAEIDGDLGAINKQLAIIQSLSNDAGSIELDKQLSKAVSGWSTNLTAFVKLMKEQSLDLSQMNWQVGMMDVSLLVETGKLEKIVNQLVAKRGGAAKGALETSTQIYQGSFLLMAIMTGVLMVLTYFVSALVVRRLTFQLGGDFTYRTRQTHLHLLERMQHARLVLGPQGYRAG
jgi:methyl-accepting chemotaxis protein